MKKNKTLLFLFLFLFLSIIIYTVAYSGLSTELGITSNVKIRPIVDIRIEEIKLKSEPVGNAEVRYEPNLWEPDWDVAKTITGFVIPDTSSSLTYEVKVKNYGTANMCIYSTSISDNSIDYQISGYTIKDIIGPGQEITFDVTYSANTPSEEIKNVIVDYDFREVFTVQYNANGGTGAPASQYKYEREDLTLSSSTPTYTGHRFLGWSTSSSGSSVEYAAGGTYTTDSSVVLYAKWETSNVKLKMNVNGGTLSENVGSDVTTDANGYILIDGSPNIHSLDYGTYLGNDGLMDYNDPSNINIVKPGYTATSGAEWYTMIDNVKTTFDQTTNYPSTAFTNETELDSVVTLNVNWETVTYNLTYVLNGGSLEDGVSNPTTYNVETPDFTLNNPTKEGSVFVGWKEASETPTTTKTITQGTMGDKTLTAVFEEVQAPTITHTPTAWTNQDVTVTISSSHNDYSYMYKIDNGSFIPYNAPFTVSQNCTVTAYSVKQNSVSSNTTHDIDNIDKIAPVLSSLTASLIETDSFTISGTARDLESGLSELRIYKDDVYVTSISYSTDVNELKNYSYEFTNLTPGTTYGISVVGYDVAGNISFESELDVTTSEQIIIVARLIGYGGVDFDYEDEEDYITFPTLKSALEYNQGGINCLTTSCKIQMLDSVIESNNILGGQDITLDLNGFTINGSRNYTFTVNNNAEFTVIDSVPFDPEQETFNEETHNSIKNTTGTAIVNNGTLTLGEGTSGQDVSIYLPYIKGATEGVNTTNGTFNFYDGRIKATTAINGEVDATPTQYNASIDIVTESGVNSQVATLKILSEVEARIGSKYYTKVGLAVNAVPDSYYEDILSTGEIMESLDSNATYKFIKSGNFLVNENTTAGTNANSYIVVDLREKTSDQLLTISTNKVVSQYDSSDINSGYITVFTGSTQSGSPRENISVEPGENTYYINLPKGSLYHLSFSYSISSSETYPEDAKMYVTGINLRDVENEVPSPYEDLETTDVSTNYGFDYDPVTKTFKSNNQYTSNTTAFSYYEIDLTNSATDKKLIVNATLSAYGNYYGFIDVKTNNDKDSSNYYNSLLCIYATTTPMNYGPMTASTTLTAGNKYYVQFYYVKYTDTYTKAQYDSMGVSDQFIINSLEVVDADPASIPMPLTSLQTPGNYGFANNSWVYPNSSEVTHSYLPIDLTATYTDMYLEVDFQSYYDFVIMNTNSTNLPTDYSGADYRNPTPTSSYTYYGPVTIPLKAGEVNYIHFIMPATSSGGTRLISATMKQGKAYPITSSLNPSAQVSASFDSYRYSDPIGARASYYNTVADSYVELDLRDSLTDVVLSVDQLIPYGGTGYIYLSDSPNAMDYNDVVNPASTKVKDMLMKFNYTGNLYRNGESANQLTYYVRTYDFVVSKGYKYYLHFGCYRTSSYYYYTINKIVTRPINNYQTKIGRQKLLPTQSGGGGSTMPDYMIIDEDNYNNLRYIGSSPNNYVSFNGELWRIVGVFETEDANGVVKPRIKLVRNTSIGSFSWDAFDTGTNNQGLNGINEWSQAKLMKLMNPGYDNESYNNSLYWNSSSGNCWYYGSSTYSSSCDFTSSGLNSTAKSMIDEVVWYTSPIASSDFSTLNAYDTYAAERNGTTTGYGLTTEYPEWTGYVGLIYMSDYIMAADGTSSNTRDACMNGTGYAYTNCVGPNSWLKGNGSPFATITPELYSPTYGGGPTFYIAMATGPNNMPTYQSNQVMPSVYLSTNIEITGGKGTATQPYTLNLGSSENENINNYYGLIPEPEDPGEIIEYETTDYQNMRYEPVYGFVYDDTYDYYINTNVNAGASTAASYVVIDRTAELTSIPVNISSFMPVGSASGLIVIMEDSFDPNVNINNSSSYSNYKYINVSSSRKTEMITLEGGKKYYIYMILKKTDSNQSVMIVNIDGLEDTTPTTIVTKYNGQNFIELHETVQILKDITLSSALSIPSTKSMTLDLNGYTLTSSNSGYVINNSGLLTIDDTKESGGNVKSTTGTTIYNNTGASLEIDGGTINYNGSSTSNAAIDNYGTVKVGAAGLVQTNNQSAYLINNRSSGDILDGTGTFGYGIIYNASTVDSGFSGYNFTGFRSNINNYGGKEYTISDITGEPTINHNGSYTLNIVDSEFGTLYPCGTSTYSSRYVTTNVNNSTGSITNGTSSQSTSTTNHSTVNITNGSNITSLYLYTGTANIDDSNVSSIYNYSSVILDDSTANYISNAYYTSASNYASTVIKGNSVVGAFGSSGNSYGVNNQGVLIIGENDGTVNSNYPRVGGIISGVYTTNSGQLKFYDGSIVGSVGNAIQGVITEIATDSSLMSTVENNKETISLGTRNVCEVNGTGYPSLQSCINAVNTTAETEVTIIEDLLETTSISIPSNRNIKIDYNDHAVKTYAAGWINNSGTLTLYDSQNTLSQKQVISSYNIGTNNGTLNIGNIYMEVKNTSTSGNNITNNGTLNINGAKIYTNYRYQNLISNSGTVVINEGDLTGYVILYNNSGSTATINGGTFTLQRLSSSSTIYYHIKNYSTLTINGGTFNNSTTSYSQYNYLVYNSSTAYIYGGTFGSYTSLLYNYSGTGTISGVTATSQYTITTNTINGTISISNSNFSFYQGNLKAIESAGPVTITDSTIGGTVRETGSGSITITNSTLKTLSTGAVLYVINSASALINGNSTIQNTASGSYNGINVTNTATLTLRSGTVIGDQTGIYNSSSGNVIIGEQGGRVSADDPNIKGGTYGINSTSSSAKLYFYDGMFTGSTNNAINSSVTSQESGYDIVTITNPNGSESKFLSNDVLVRNTTIPKDYSSFDEALAEASSGDTLKLLRDLVTTSSFTTLTIPSAMSLTIDMNNHVINQNGTSGPFIENNGILTFVDSYYASNGSTASSIRNNTTNPTITNNGSLIITYYKGEARVSGASIINNTASSTVTAGDLNLVDNNSNRLITNNGTFTINSGTVNGGNSTTGGILNNDTMTINNLTYSNGSLGLDNTGTLTVRGGTYSSTTALSNSGTANISADSNALSATKISNSGTLNMSSGTVGQITTSGDAYITGGIVTSSTEAIIVTGTGSVYLGTKDGTASTTSPSITSNSSYYAITGSNIYFYDGVVKGKDLPIHGTIVDVETDHNIIYDFITGEVLTPNDIVENERTTDTYTSFSSAITDASNGDSLKVLENVVIFDSSQNAVIPSGKTLELNVDKIVYEDAGTTFTNNGTLTVKGQSYLRDMDGTPLIINNGTLTLDDEDFTYDQSYEIYSGLRMYGSITNNGTFNLENAVVEDIDNSGTMVVDFGIMLGTITNTGTVTINDGYASVSNKPFLQNNYQFGTDRIININDGTFKLTNSTAGDAAIIMYSGELNIDGGIFRMYGEGALVHSDGGTTNITDGEFRNRNNSASNYRKSSLLHITNGTVNVSDITEMELIFGDIENGNLYISNVSLSNDYYGGISVTGSYYPDISIIFSDFTHGFTGRNTSFIQTNDTTHADITIANVTLTPSVSTDLINIGQNSNLTILNNSDFEVSYRAIYNKGTLTIGEKDNTYNINHPHIIGSLGVYNDGTFNFYDGTITGGSTAIYGQVNDVATGYIVDTSTESGVVNAFLRVPGENERVIIFNNINYSNLQDAIDVAPANATSTMVLYTNYVLPQDIVVPSGKIINLYLNGYTIDNDGHTITGSLNQISGLPVGASVGQLLNGSISSNISKIVLLLLGLCAITLGLVYIKKKKKS